MLDRHEEKIDFFVRSSLPPVEGVFFDGQVYDAYAFVAGLIRKVQRRIVLIDNYIDETVLTMLDKRNIRSGLDSPLWNTLVLNFCLIRFESSDN